MLKHDLTAAFRSFLRNPQHGVICVCVLALGLICFVAAYIFVSYMRSYDQQFAKSDRTYVIGQSVQEPIVGLSKPLQTQSSLALAERLKLDVPELAAIARYVPHALPVLARINGVEAHVKTAYADPALLDIFDFSALSGSLKQTLTKAHTAIITEQAAERIFHTADVVGKTVTLGSSKTVDVTIEAVIATLPKASHLSATGLFSAGFELLVSWDVFEQIAKPKYMDSWASLPAYTYVLLPSDRSLSIDQLNLRLNEVVAHHVPNSSITVGFRALPLSAVSADLLQKAFQGEFGVPWRISVLNALLWFAGAVLAVGCLNFVNLAMAYSVGRGFEIGTRKAVGAKAAQLIRQDLVRTALLVAAAILSALVAIVPVNRMLSVRWQAALVIPWAEPRFWLFLAVLLIIVTLAAGLYPALILARIRPVEALRLGAIRAGPKLMRKLLSVSQFAVASFLMVAVIIIFAQGHQLRTVMLRRFDDPYLILRSDAFGPRTALAANREVFKKELSEDPEIEGITATDHVPYYFPSGRVRIRRTPQEQAAQSVLEVVFVAKGYFSFFHVPLVAGRIFEKDAAGSEVRPSSTDKTARKLAERAVIDRAAARALGWNDPADAIGQIVYGYTAKPFEIVGVVANVPMTIRSRGSAGTIYRLHPNFATWTIVHIRKDAVPAALRHIDHVLKALVPNGPPASKIFFDRAFNDAYRSFAMINKVFAAFAVVAIMIAGIGLFGLASYMTKRRTREIGLRKTQGASSTRILRMLLWDFSKPVLVANLIVWPLAFVAAQRYLGLFVERIALTPLPFVLGLLATLAIAWLSVAGRVLHAAHIRPSDALRHE